ncbi:type I secretion system permease/ATPase [Bradyrhizobium liaoningense]|uniref:type I secretion system permease/ATPase n=1 Tax=Bradyrhizobium liaoningense TaxID=43992 RepID=UPI001BAA44D5|nr:type I secretion system permease/ATPase [Bradyrhizobium liaoningense]MBR0904584.1 type I secretion system permease/ATPase [Bradyrhizobium liaoningense]
MTVQLTPGKPASSTSSPIAAGSAVLDSGLMALALVAAVHSVPCDVNQVRHELGIGDRATDAGDLVRGGKLLKMKVRRLVQQPIESLGTVPLPAILQLRNGQFVIFGRRNSDNTLRLVDAVTRSARQVSLQQMEEEWDGIVVLVARRFRLDPLPGEFGIRWFLPSVWKYRRPLGSVIAASLFIQLCALATPLLFQIIIDKVLVHHGYSTLVMVVVGMGALAFFGTALQWLRTYVLSHTASRIDVELGAKLFDHMLRLPLSYFEQRPTGQTVARVRELETVRSFLTGQALLSSLDLVFATIFIAVMYAYSPFLATIALVSLPLYVIVGFLLRPLLRDRINLRFNKSALSTQFLVESIVGVHTIKAMAVEPIIRNEWEDRLAGYVKSSLDAIYVGATAQNLIQFINKIATAAVLFFGAQAVINGDLTVGALIAFNMIFSQLTSPILRLSQLWQDFQQVKISVDRIGDILNKFPEATSMSKVHLPPAKGRITIRNLTFRYNDGGREVLSNINLDIPAGQVIGIVGPSGSGKSTLTKIIQRLYVPERGQVLVDGIDIAQVDPSWLRRQVGVVLQENLLFNKTVHENIALANPAMPRSQVIAVARLSGADEFINSLPLGYDTIIEERGANLSGGQRQRLAIARSLATNPKILIFDEATSALDYESERVIQENMRHIVRSRTVIVIAHRLAAVRGCDRIIAVQDGRIVEDGTHRELIDLPTSLYGRMWRIQSEGSAA